MGPPPPPTTFFGASASAAVAPPAAPRPPHPAGGGHRRSRPGPVAPCGAGPSAAAGVAIDLRCGRAVEGAEGAPSTLSAALCPSFCLALFRAVGGAGCWTAATLSAAPCAPAPLNDSPISILQETFPLPRTISSLAPFFPAHMRDLRKDASPRSHPPTPFSSRWCHLLTPPGGPSPP